MKNVTKIFGAPGCGKTHRLLDLLEDLLKVYLPNEIAYVSFTRKGAYEGKDRAIEKFGYKEKDFPFFKTLHSIAFKQMGLSRYDVIGRKNYKVFSKAMGMNFTGYYTEDFTSNDDQYLFQYFLRLNNPRYAKLIENTLDQRKIEFVTKNYNRFKEQFGLTDFTDMLVNFKNDKKALPVKVAIIDEAQDLTTLQWEVCQVAFKNCDKVFVAGDDDQAIYEWSGADVNYFLDLPGEEVILDHSYRMPSNIVTFSKRISEQIYKRVDKQFTPREEKGCVKFYNDINELDLDLSKTYYFLARNNYFLSVYRKFLKEKGIVYKDKDKGSVDSKLVRAIIAYERYRKNGKYDNELDVILVKKYKRPEVKRKAEWFEYFNLSTEDIDYYRMLVKEKAKLKDSKIMVNTIHGVKGGEADNVVLMLDITKNVRNAYYIYQDAELRCLYVACTRAKTNLHIIFSNTKNGYNDIINFQNLGRGIVNG